MTAYLVTTASRLPLVVTGDVERAQWRLAMGQFERARVRASRIYEVEEVERGVYRYTGAALVALDLSPVLPTETLDITDTTALDALLAVEPLSECCAARPHHPCEDRCGDCHDNAVFTRTCPVCEAEVYPGDEPAHVTLACPTLHDEAANG